MGSTGWMKLCSLISQYLIWLAILMDTVFQELDGTFSRRIVMDLTAWNESAMVVQVANHPFIAIGHFEV